MDPASGTAHGTAVIAGWPKVRVPHENEWRGSRIAPGLIATWLVLGYSLSMPEPLLAHVVERIVLAGIAITTRALAGASSAYELTFPQWRVLFIVGESNDGATVSEVATRLGVTVPATSRQIRRMGRRGLVDIGQDESDHRAVRARLTAHGQAMRSAILSYRRRQIVETVARVHLSSATRRELALLADAFDAFR